MKEAYLSKCKTYLIDCTQLSKGVVITSAAPQMAFSVEFETSPAALASSSPLIGLAATSFLQNSSTKVPLEHVFLTPTVYLHGYAEKGLFKSQFEQIWQSVFFM